MKREISRVRQLRLVQIVQLVIFAMTPVPLVMLYNFSKIEAPIGSWFFGLEQFLEATAAELILAIASLWLRIKVYRMGSKMSSKSKKVVYWTSGISILILYIANVNILIVLPCFIIGIGVVNLKLTQSKIVSQNSHNIETRMSI